MNSVLVTGSCGFIFSNFVRRVNYLKLPFKLVCIDKITSNQFMNNIYLSKNNSFYLADICDSHAIDRIFDIEKPDVVIHGAAESSVDSSIYDSTIFARTNVVGTQVLLNASVKHKIKKFLYVSTDEVYGCLKNTSEPSWTEESPTNPKNTYSASKAAGELLVRATSNQFDLPFIITRSCNNYGERQSNNKFIPTIIKSIFEKKKIPIYGDGSMIREWINVFDNINAILKILESSATNSVFNIGSRVELTNLELVQKICNILGGHELISFVSDPRGKNHDIRYSVNSSKLRSLGWEQQVRISDGLEKTCNWYKNNQFFLK